MHHPLLLLAAVCSFPSLAAAQASRPAADVPAQRADANSRAAHADLLAKARQGRIDVYFVGDSITRRWGATDRPDLLAHWRRTFHGWNAANFGWGGDATQHILWRLENGELDGVNPKVIVVLAGTNNLVARRGNTGLFTGPDGEAADEVVRGLKAILATCRRKAPDATIILTAVFPRDDDPSLRPTIDRINGSLRGLADGKRVRYLDVNDGLTDPLTGKVRPGMMDPDGLHPAIGGYQVWSDGLRPILAELLGPPAKDDHAPPPTGDPSRRAATRPAAK